MNSAIKQEVQTSKAPIKIYSENVIQGFSVIFSSVFGTILLMENLIAIGKKGLAYAVLGASVLYTILTIFLVNIPKEPKLSYVLILNIIGGFLLVHIFHKRHFMDESIYEKKHIRKPLIISLLIAIPMVLAMVFLWNETLVFW